MRKAKMAKKRTRARIDARRSEQKPIKLTRSHVTARDHKDLSTYELNCRSSSLNFLLNEKKEEIEQLSRQLASRRNVARSISEDIAAIEGLIEGRR